MSKESLLLVDGDTRSLRVLEVSLRKAGFSVTPAVSVGDALDKLELNPPDLIISETKFSTELDGFELRRRLRQTPEWAEIPFIFLTAETAIENKIRGLELGVDDYLTKPIYIKEIVTRINILLQKRQRQFLDLKKDGTRFAGRVADMPVVDVIQTIEVSRKSGVIQFSGGPNRQAAIYFREGKVIDAEAGTLQGEDAVYRLLTWNEGEFEVEFRTVRRREQITTSSQGLLMEGMRRLDEWSRLLEQLPPLTHRFEIDAAELAIRLGEVPDDNNRILRLFDGRRTLLEVIDASDFGDLECLQTISRLYFEGLLLDLDPDIKHSRRDTGKPMPLVVVEEPRGPTPIEKVASGPLPVDSPMQAAKAAMAVEGERRAVAMAIVGDSLAQQQAAVPASPVVDRPSAEQITEDAVVSEEDVLADEEIHSPLAGDYRPSSLRLIDEAIAAAAAIEPSLFEPDELIAAGLMPPPSATTIPPPSAAAMPPPGAGEDQGPVSSPDTASDVAAQALAADAPPIEGVTEAQLARVKITPRSIDPRISAARDLVELTPAVPNDPAESPANGSRTKVPSNPPLSAEAAAKPSLGSKDLEIPSSGDFTIPLNAGAPQEPSTEEDSQGVPAQIDEDDDLTHEDQTDPERPSRKLAATVRRDDTQRLRMIGSHGRDRAEASGELRPLPARATTAEPVEPQRELVTILPRRITREIPTVSADALKSLANGDGATSSGDTAKSNGDTTKSSNGDATKPGNGDAATGSSAESAKSASDTAAKSAAVAWAEATRGVANAGAKAGEVRSGEITRAGEVRSGEIPRVAPGDSKEAPAASNIRAKPAVEPPRPPPPRVSAEGGTRTQGPGRTARILLVAGAVVVGATVFAVCSKKKSAQVAVTRDDAAAVTATPADATEYAGFGIDAGTVATHVDAGVRDATQVATLRRDAGVRRADAAVASSPVDAGIDKHAQAKALYEKAHAALEDGDPEKALGLIEQSLALRPRALTYLEQARALQRMGRIDDAIAAVDRAIASNRSYAPAYEQKGMILWSAQRYAEARPVLEKYIEMDPDGRRVETIKSMLDEPK